MADQIIGKNKAVFITYSIVNERGEVFEQSDVPIGYVHGADSGLFEKVEEALQGRAVGDRIEVVLTPEEGFGEHRAELVYTDDIENVPEEYRRVGAEVEFENERGENMQFHVTRIQDGKLTIDANHALAGQTVTFVVTVAVVRDATPEEVANGRPDAESGYLLH